MFRFLAVLVFALGVAAQATAAEDYERHALTPAMVTSLSAATKELEKLPPIKKMNRESEDETSVEDIRRTIDSVPAAKPILARHGFTSQTYAMAFMAFVQASLHVAMEPSMDKKTAAEMMAGHTKETRANIEMLRKNRHLMKMQD